MVETYVLDISSENLETASLSVCSKFFLGGEGGRVVDGEGDSSEGCLKWGGGGH